MAKELKILTIYNKEEEKILRTKSSPVEKDEFGRKELIDFSKDLLETAKKSDEPAGGIAAPQVGVNKDIFYLLNYDTDRWEIFVNPIVEPLGFTKTSIEESCLSVPDREEKVLRYKKIKVTYQDLYGKKHMKKFSDLNAITVQHEKDHLEGILFIDRI
ncbi:MAG TPA: peptide deformylase [Candidatus Dojkabacteria bacterium]|nr:peptide deformylase [Candidatus Dojkabacteria bacterium]